MEESFFYETEPSLSGIPKVSKDSRIERGKESKRQNQDEVYFSISMNSDLGPWNDQ